MNWNSLALSSTWFSPFIVRFLMSAVVLLIGFVVAQIVTKAIRRVTVSLFSQKQVAESPLGEVVFPLHTLRGSGAFSSVVYAVVLFIFIAISGEILGITFFSQIVSQVLAFLPNLASALIVLILGFVLAGFAEKIVKQQFRRFLSSHATLAGTAASSAVLILFSLMALAEIGIAQEFIFILFAGVVFSFALAGGLAFGLGSQDAVREMITHITHQGEVEKEARKKK